MFRKTTLFFISVLILANVTGIFAQPDMQTLTLNTGYNHANQSTFAVGGGQKDDYWQLVSDPISTTVDPRRANTIPPYGSAWKPAMPMSTWLSYSINGSQGIMVGDYIYRKCFCLKKGFDSKDAIKKTIMNLSVRADDDVYVHLNKVPTTTDYILKKGPTDINGSFSSVNPAQVELDGEKLFGMLKVGTNCLYANVKDTMNVVTGFNLKGSITAAGIDGVASFNENNKEPLFNKCSSCTGNTKDDTKSISVAVINGDKIDFTSDRQKIRSIFQRSLAEGNKVVNDEITVDGNDFYYQVFIQANDRESPFQTLNIPLEQSAERNLLITQNFVIPWSGCKNDNKCLQNWCGIKNGSCICNKGTTAGTKCKSWLDVELVAVKTKFWIEAVRAF
jgi:hypothetical protein